MEHEVAAFIDNAIRIWLYVDNKDFVTYLRCTNNWTRTVRISITRPSGQVFETLWAPGDSFTQNIPRNRQFRYSDEVLSDFAVTLTVV